MALLYYPPSVNGIQKTLDAQLDTGVTASLTLNNTTSIQNKPGVIVINRIDASGTEKDAADREFIIYTAVSGNTLTGLTRNADNGSSDQDHASGSVVEFIPDVLWGQGIIDFLKAEHNETDGTHGAITATSIDVGSTIAVTGVLDEDDMSSDSAVKLATQQSIKAYVDTEVGAVGDWKTLGQTLTYASADDPTYTATVSGVDMTDTLSVGMRMRVSQSTGGTKYFIITAIAFSTDTTITLYGGTDYNLENEAISSPVYSSSKAPFGFPLDPDKWSVITEDTGADTQASAAQNTWYNMGTITLAIPIGSWRVYYEVTTTNNHATDNMYTTLSTANNSESDIDFTILNAVAGTGSFISFYREKTIILAAKATYYLNHRTSGAGNGTLTLRGDLSTTRICAICAYL